jgi:hypothetical protein
MASLDSLPADQRAVLQLVLQKGRSYDEIAQLLSIDIGAVRERALSALAAVGPTTRVPSERRAEISDYLLGQLPSAAAARARDRIAESATERAWARVVASELAPLAASSLPEIPVESAPRRSEPFGALEPRPGPSAEPETIAREPVAAGAPTEAATTSDVAQAMGLGGSEPPPAPRSSRIGGAILLGAGALVAVIVIVIAILLVSNGGGSSGSHVVGRTAAATATTSASASTSTSATSTTAARPIAQVNLTSPTHNQKVAGVAEIIKQGSKEGLVIVAQGVPANSNHDAYAVWLYNSPSDSHRLGFVNPGVKTDGKLQTAGLLPADATRFRHLLVTLETQARPPGPGKIVLQGPLKISQ